MTDRPLFCELVPSEMGYRWDIPKDCRADDRQGTWIFTDTSLNMVVVALGKFRRSFGFPSYSKFDFSDGCQFSIDNSPNTLFIFSCGEKLHAEPLAPGVSHEIRSYIRQRIQSDEEQSDALLERMIESGWIKEFDLERK